MLDIDDAMLLHIHKKETDTDTNSSSNKSRRRRKSASYRSNAVSINTSRTHCFEDAEVRCRSDMDGGFEVKYDNQTYVVQLKDGAEEFLHLIIQLYDVYFYTNYPLSLARAIVYEANQRCWAARSRRKFQW